MNQLESSDWRQAEAPFLAATATEVVTNLRILVASALLLSVLTSCRAREEPVVPTLEAVDVPPAIAITPENDVRAVAPPPALVGLLPDDFPADLPLYLPASLVDIGSDGATRSVSLISPDPLVTVQRETRRILRQAGWVIDATGGSSGGLRLHKGERRVRLWIEDARPGTRCRFVYSP